MKSEYQSVGFTVVGPHFPKERIAWVEQQGIPVQVYEDWTGTDDWVFVTEEFPEELKLP